MNKNLIPVNNLTIHLVCCFTENSEKQRFGEFCTGDPQRPQVNLFKVPEAPKKDGNWPEKRENLLF